MKFQDLVEALYAAGWQAPGDAQHANLKELHAKLFPAVAALEAELEDMTGDLQRTMREVDKLRATALTPDTDNYLGPFPTPPEST